MQELSDLWRTTSPDAVNISGDFSPRESAAVLHHLKPGKALGPDSICLELLIHAGPSLRFCLCAVFPLNAKKVQICEIMSSGFAVKIQQCVKKVRRFLVTFSLC